MDKQLLKDVQAWLIGIYQTIWHYILTKLINVCQPILSVYSVVVSH